MMELNMYELIEHTHCRIYISHKQEEYSGFGVLKIPTLDFPSIALWTISFYHKTLERNIFDLLTKILVMDEILR